MQISQIKSVIICENLCPIKDAQIIDLPFFSGDLFVDRRNAKIQPVPLVPLFYLFCNCLCESVCACTA